MFTARHLTGHILPRCVQQYRSCRPIPKDIPRVPFVLLSAIRPTISKDRDTLVRFYWGTGGKGWTKNDNWDTYAELSTWYGVEVDDQGLVVKLLLSDNNLEGIKAYPRGDVALLCDLPDLPGESVNRKSLRLGKLWNT